MIGELDAWLWSLPVWVWVVVAAVVWFLAAKHGDLDGVDRAERKFFAKHRGRHSDQSMLEYLDHKRALIGRPRRPGKNADIVETLQQGSKR